MGQALNEVVFHVDEQIGQGALDELERNLCRRRGAHSVRHAAGREHLLVIAYDTNQVKAIDFLTAFREHGLSAQLLGM